jgi:hypothetical protein
MITNDHEETHICRVIIMVFNATFNNIAVTSWLSVLLVYTMWHRTLKYTNNNWLSQITSKIENFSITFYGLWWTGQIIYSYYTSVLRRVWRYQRGNQNPYIEEEQTTQWPKEKVQKDKQRSTKHTYKTKDRVTRTPLKTGLLKLSFVLLILVELLAITVKTFFCFVDIGRIVGLHC